MSDLIHITTINEALASFELNKPKHPLISVYHHKDLKKKEELTGKKFLVDLYQISFKECVTGSFGYGRNSYDFQEGTLIFTSPGQVMTMPDWKEDVNNGGWTLLFHPDLVRKSNFGKNIKNYTFFSYSINEALHISETEKQTILELVNKIKKEYGQNIDKHTQKLIVSNTQLILDYCTRFYDRQFYTRENINKDIVTSFEELLWKYYDSALQLDLGIPNVKYCGEELNMSSNYLSDLLKKETGRSAQDHIHFFVIEKAKTLLLNTSESVSQIGYGLGFDYPQHFSKLFKKKTGINPAEYRNLN